MTSEIDSTTRQLETALEAARERLAAQERELERLRALVHLDEESLGEVLQATGFRTLQDLRRCCNRAFELAFFVLGESWRAFDVTLVALKDLTKERRRQERRRGYLLRSTRPRKAYLDPPQSCQALLLAASTPHELEQEQKRGLSQQDLVIRLVKHLVEISLKARSWWLNLALSCLLRGADLKEAWQLQRLLDQQPNPRGKPREYVSDPLRRRMTEDKANLEKRLAERFEALVDESGQRELRWRPIETTELEHWSSALDRVFDCLQIWDAPDAKEILAIEKDPHCIPALQPADSSPDEIARVELCRKALLLSPEGFARLAARLQLSHLDSRWHMPSFFTAKDPGPSAPPPFDPPVLGGRNPEQGLSEEQFESILARLSLEIRDSRETTRAESWLAECLQRLHWPRMYPALATTLALALALLVTAFLVLPRTAPPPVTGVAFRQLDFGNIVERSGVDIQLLRIPRHANSLVLVVPLDLDTPPLPYRLELHLPSGEVWRGEVRTIDGELSLALPASELTPGLYRLHLSPAAGPREEGVEIPFRMSFDE